MSFFKLIFIIPILGVLALAPFQSGRCECAVAGAVCGDEPTWNPCCEPDKYECKKNEGDDFGTCEEKTEKAKEEKKD